MTDKTILVPIFSWSLLTVCQRRGSNRYLFFAHERETLWSPRLIEINVRASSLSFFPTVSAFLLLTPPPHTSASHLSLPLSPTFPPAMIKGQWQIYTHSAAQPCGLLKVRGNDLEIPYRQMWRVRAHTWACGLNCVILRQQGWIIQLNLKLEIRKCYYYWLFLLLHHFLNIFLIYK